MQFQKQLSRFLDNTEQLTFYTVNGITIQSSFSLVVSITVQDVLGERIEEQIFPFIVRSEKCGEYIHDLDMAPKQMQVNTEFDFLQPFSLPGCNFFLNLK